MLKPYYGCCRFTRILPVTYTDSISPYDQMCKIQDKINEVIEALNNINVDFENYVNQKINELKTYVDSENQKQTILLENEINEVDGKLSTFIETTYAEFVNSLKYMKKSQKEFLKYILILITLITVSNS